VFVIAVILEATSVTDSIKMFTRFYAKSGRQISSLIRMSVTTLTVLEDDMDENERQCAPVSKHHTMKIYGE
jgi:hypothetical protein